MLLVLFFYKTKSIAAYCGLSSSCTDGPTVCTYYPGHWVCSADGGDCIFIPGQSIKSKKVCYSEICTEAVWNTCGCRENYTCKKCWNVSYKCCKEYVFGTCVRYGTCWKSVCVSDVCSRCKACYVYKPAIGYYSNAVNTSYEGNVCGGPTPDPPPPCNKRNGGWSSWSACALVGGVEIQRRTCTNPSPSCGGASCTGSSTQTCSLCAENDTYTLKVNVKEDTNGCSNLGNAMADAKVSVYRQLPAGGAGSPITAAPVPTDASGVATFNNVSVNDKSFYVTVSKSTGGENPDYYQLTCPTTYGYQITLDPAPAECSTQYIPTQAGYLGIKKLPKLPWLTAIDGDVFAQGITTTIPVGSGSGGFNLSLVNAKGDSTSGIGGYIATRDFLPSSDDSLFENSLGGKMHNLEGLSKVKPSNIFDISLDNLANRRSFSPPTHNDVVEVSSLSSFEAGKVYKISVSDFNAVMEDAAGPISYTISQSQDTVLSSSGVSTAVLYIEGSDDVVFGNRFVTLGSSGLIIVANTNIVISKDIGYTTIAEYSILSTPLIQAAILTSGNISFESLETTPGTDIPLMVQGPLVTTKTISQNRDLGSDLNGQYPPLSISFNNKFLYDLSVIERYKSQSFNRRSYTGLSTYDLQFDYPD